MRTINLKVTIIAGLLAVTVAGLDAQRSNDGPMPQYYFGDFSVAKVLMKNGQVQNTEMDYNMVTEKMIFIRDGKYYDLMNSEMVDTIFLKGSRFVPVGKAFYQVLYNGTSALFAEYKGQLLPAGKQVGYGGTSQVAAANYLSTINLSGQQYNLPLPAEYEVKPSTIYWIFKDNQWKDFMTEKQFLKLFPDKSDKLKAFIKENRLKFDRTEDLVKLYAFLSKL